MLPFLIRQLMGHESHRTTSREDEGSRRMAACSQTLTQAPHSVQFSRKTAFFSCRRTAPRGQSLTQYPQPIHFSLSTFIILLLASPRRTDGRCSSPAAANSIDFTPRSQPLFGSIFELETLFPPPHDRHSSGNGVSKTSAFPNRSLGTRSERPLSPASL